MQFRDLKKQYHELKTDIDSAIFEVLNDCNFISGNQVSQLEEMLEEYTGREHCITCANGTDALSMMMMAWGIRQGDAVFVPDFTFFSSAEIVSFAGAVPVFYDVNMDTFNADSLSLAQAVESVLEEGSLRPKAVIVVDLFGLPADYEQIKSVADKYNLLILEDGAQGFGGSINGQKACSFGDAATTSFFPAKPLGCYGDGGAVFVDDAETAEYLKSIRVHGKGTFKYDNVRIGLNSRLDTIQAAVLQVKLKAFREYEVKEVNRVADSYSDKLKGVVKTPSVPNGYLSSWAQYSIQLPDSGIRDGLQAHLKDNGIPTMIYYPKPMSSQSAFADIKKYIECPVSERLSKTVLALPMHPYLEEKEIETVSKHIKDYLG